MGFGPKFQPLQQAHASQIVSHILRMWRLTKKPEGGHRTKSDILTRITRCSTGDQGSHYRWKTWKKREDKFFQSGNFKMLPESQGILVNQGKFDQNIIKLFCVMLRKTFRLQT